MESKTDQPEFATSYGVGLILGFVSSFLFQWIGGLMLGIFLGISVKSSSRFDFILIFIVFFFGALLGIVAAIVTPQIRKQWPTGSSRKIRIVQTFGYLFLALCILASSFSVGFMVPAKYSSEKASSIERNFAHVKKGMTSGEALKTIFDGVYIFPQEMDRINAPSNLEQWPVWDYDLVTSLRGRVTGSSPFTLTIDKDTGLVVESQREYNTRFD